MDKSGWRGRDGIENAALHDGEGGLLRDHNLGRSLDATRHRVRLMSAEYDRPSVEEQKGDEPRWAAIDQAATRPTMRFVALQTAGQCDRQSLHRVRDHAAGERTVLIKPLGAVLAERRTRVPQGRRTCFLWSRGQLRAPRLVGIERTRHARNASSPACQGGSVL